MSKSIKYLFMSVLFLFSLSTCWAAEKVTSEQKSFIESKVSNMSLEQKVGQVMIGWFSGTTLTSELEARIRNIHLGGVIFYQWTHVRNVENKEQFTQLVNDLQTTALDAGQIPLFIALDQENGWGNMYGFSTIFPTNMALGAIGDEDTVAKAASITARELREMGVTINFAPCVDVNNNPRNPIIGVRSFGSTAQDVARLARTVIPPYEKEGVLIFAKHFPGHGDTAIDTHVGLPVINQDINHLKKVELYPFQEMINSGIPGIMSAHVIMPAVDPSRKPATLSKKAMDMLRNEMAFKGLIVTDALNMRALTAQRPLEEVSIEAFQAGADILLFGGDIKFTPEYQDKVFAALVAAVKDGRISVDRLDDSVRKILTYKVTYGIFEKPFASKDPKISLPEDAAFALDTAKNSITLVKDDHKLLPLNPNSEIPILLPKEYESYLYEVLLEEGKFLKPYFLPQNPTSAEVELTIQKVKDSPVVVIPTFSRNNNENWVKLINGIDPNKVVAIALSSPYDLLKYPKVSTYITVYGAIPTSQVALCQLLKGEFQPKGHLPVDIPGLYKKGWGMTTLQ